MSTGSISLKLLSFATTKKIKVFFFGLLGNKFKNYKMRNLTQTKAPRATVKENNEVLVIDFQNFNGVTLAKISDKNDRKTFAYGSDEKVAKDNAIKLYQRKYNTPYFSL